MITSSISRRAPMVFAAACLLAAAGCGADGSIDDAPAVAIVKPDPGSIVAGNVVTLTLTAADVSIVPADGDTSGKTAHFHVFLDSDPVSPGIAIEATPGIIHSASESIEITGLSLGEHRIVVVLGDGKHQRLGDAQASTTVIVRGPSVQAHAETQADGMVTLSMTVRGVELSKADGDTSGKTGHLHVLIDRELPAMGQPIPKEPGIVHTTEPSVEIGPLTAGEHTIDVVLADGKHIPFDPPVRDRIMVSVP